LPLQSCTRSASADDPEQELAGDLGIFLAVESGSAVGLNRFWQAARPVAVMGRHGVAANEVIVEACRADGVDVLRRSSGGGAVVLGPGCLNYAVALSLVSRPELTDVAASFQLILEAIVSALGIPGVSIQGGTDLALNGRKVSGSAQRRGRRAILHQGTLLYDFDSSLATRYLKEPARQPAYRGSRPHADFLGNIPLSRDTIRERLEAAWRSMSGDEV
jgi:lipoate-protein ligase A